MSYNIPETDLFPSLREGGGEDSIQLSPLECNTLMIIYIMYRTCRMLYQVRLLDKNFRYMICCDVCTSSSTKIITQPRNLPSLGNSYGRSVLFSNSGIAQ
jgi:hypothetical protein